jgi:ABC-type Fe3+-hydroxamate transport system substrate-binding protein
MRVVSLVPSATETLVALGTTPVACTRFCDLAGVATVGGTKNPDLEAIMAIAPDLVVVNDEENRREDADALVAAGLRLHSVSPRSVADVGPGVRRLADAIGAPVPAPFSEPAWSDWLEAGAPQGPERRRAAVLVWRRPWMTSSGDTYGSSVLGMLAIDNLWAEAAERYPEITLGDLAAAVPDLVLMPDEPYPFSARHVPEVAAAVPGARAMVVDGRDLFWWGIRTPAAIGRLRQVLWG